MNVCFLQVNVRRFAPRDPTVVQGQLLGAADAKNRDQARLNAMHIDVLAGGQGFHDPSLDSIVWQSFQPQTTNEVIRMYYVGLCQCFIVLLILLCFLILSFVCGKQPTG